MKGAGVRLFCCEVSTLHLPRGNFDIILQSTVFTSILDDALCQRVAQKMWEAAKPGGFIPWYDFIHANPYNRGVRAVSVREMKRLFPEARYQICKTALHRPQRTRGKKLRTDRYETQLYAPNGNTARLNLIRQSTGTVPIGDADEIEGRDPQIIFPAFSKLPIQHVLEQMASFKYKYLNLSITQELESEARLTYVTQLS